MEKLLKRLNDAQVHYVVIDGIPVKYLNLDDLLSSKKAAARAKDSDDILFLTIKKQNQ